jgi:hypothetical protein
MKRASSPATLCVLLWSACAVDEDVGETRLFALEAQAFEASHNTYLADNTPADDITWHFTSTPPTRHIELDLRDTSVFGTVSGNWRVSHGYYDAPTVHCDGSGLLTDCLDRIDEYHDTHSGHALISVWLDKKQDWEGIGSTQRSPAKLDSLLSTRFGNGLLSPGQLSDGSPTLRSVIQSDGWNLYTAGKIMFILTSDADCTGNDRLEYYVNNRGASAKAFIAPHGNALANVENSPQCFDSAAADGWAAIYNFEWVDDNRNGLCDSNECWYLDDAHQMNFLTRAWDLDDGAEYAAAEDAGANFLPVEYPWESGEAQYLDD